MTDQVLSSLHYKGDLNGFHSLQLGPVLAFASLCGLTQWMGTPSASQIWKQFKMIRGKYNWKIHLFWWFSFWNPCIWETFKETVEDLHYEKLHGVPISCGHSLPRWCKPKLQFMFQCLGGEEAVSVEHLPPVYNRWHSLLSLTAHHNESGLLSHLRAEEVGVFDYLPDARRAGRRSLVAISVPALQYDFYLAYISWRDVWFDH